MELRIVSVHFLTKQTVLSFLFFSWWFLECQISFPLPGCNVVFRDRNKMYEVKSSPQHTQTHPRKPERETLFCSPCEWTKDSAGPLGSGVRLIGSLQHQGFCETLGSLSSSPEIPNFLSSFVPFKAMGMGWDFVLQRSLDHILMTYSIFLTVLCTDTDKSLR